MNDRDSKEKKIPDVRFSKEENCTGNELFFRMYKEAAMEPSQSNGDERMRLVRSLYRQRYDRSKK